MYATWIRTSLVGVTVFAIGGSPAPVLGNYRRGGEVIVAPSETILAVPTSYVLPTSTYYPTSLEVPTSYVVPTVYSTSYVSPTYMLTPTAYVVPTYYRAARPWARRRLAQRPIYAETSYYLPTTSYFPTTYYPSSAIYPTSLVYPTSVVYPTVRDYAVVTTSATICDESTPTRSVAAQESNPEASSRVPRAIRSPGREQAPGSVIQSQPAAAAGDRDDERTASGDVPPNPSTSTPGSTTPPPVPPAVPDTRTTAPPPNTSTPGSGQPGAVTPERGPAPPDSSPIELPDPTTGATEETMRRESRRPAGLSQARIPRNVLEGKVVSVEDGRAEENVRVTVSHRNQAFVDRFDTTDASGRYSIRVPDGDWTVKVTMPSGRVYDVYQVTVSGAEITDDRGEPLAGLTITR